MGSANAKLVRPHTRLDRQHEAEAQHKTFMAGNYVKTTARGCGHYQAIVSPAFYTTYFQPLYR
jgi:hypothetical protein